MAPKPQKALTEAQELEDGDKLLKGSVRPDGTVRKDRRIRAGYTPQDEQPAYQPRAAEVGVGGWGAGCDVWGACKGCNRRAP